MQDAATPLANQLLIASPALSDPNFARSVTLICQHDDDGAMGVIVNRASEYTLGEVLRQMNLASQDPRLDDQVVLAGGPVHPERGFVLHDSARAWESTLEVADGLFLTTSRDILEAMAAGDGPAHAVVALGCAGWGAGQLEREIRENVWLTCAADETLIFGGDHELKWTKALAKIGVDARLLTATAGRA